MGDAGRMAARKMFGEYALYCDDKVVALVCDNSLFVTPTDEGRAFEGGHEWDVLTHLRAWMGHGCGY